MKKPASLHTIISPPRCAGITGVAVAWLAGPGNQSTYK